MTARIFRFSFTTCSLLLLAAGTASAEPLAEPYTVWVAHGGAQVFSGPDETYYATDALTSGQECQVYEELPGGWLAIRPPEGSFSVVASQAIEPAGEGVVRVVRETASSRVGSKLTTKHDAMHVRLERGELLQLSTTTSSEPAWTKIEPPAGEFRYLHSKDVSRSKVSPSPVANPVPLADSVGDKTITASAALALESPDDSQAESSSQPGSIQPVRYDNPPMPAQTPAPGQFVAPNLIEQVTPVAVEPQSPPTTSPTTPAMATADTSAGWQATGTSSATAPSATVNLPATTPGTAAAVAVPPQSPGAQSQGPRSLAPQTAFDAQLDQIEVQVSRRVAGPVNLWRFEDLERSAAQLLSVATTPDQTRTVNELASRLSRLGELGRRHRQADLPDGAVASAAANTSPSAAASSNPSSTATSSQYDAVGVLRPVVSSRGNAPPYALVDERGEVVTFVTPAPSLNLQPHLGKRIGVSGTRGFLPAYSRRNIQTASVAPLGGNTVR